MKPIKLYAVLTVTLAMAVLLAACGSSTSSRARPTTGSYVVGSTGDLSGPLAAIGTALRNGYQAYFSYQNSHGGINGHDVKLIALDDQSETTLGVANAKQLTQSDHVSGAFVFLSNVIVAAAPIFNATHTPVIVQAATGSLLHPVEPEIFAGSIIIGGEPTPSISFLSTKLGSGSQRVAVIAAETVALSGYVNHAIALSKQKGWDVVSNQQVSLSATTAAPQATVMAAAKPTVVLMALTDPLAISAVETLRQQGFTGPVVNYDGGSGYNTLLKLKDPNFYVIRPFPYATATSPGSNFTIYETAAHDAGLNPNQSFVINGYVQAWIMGQGLKRCGYPCSPTELTKALDGLSNVNTHGLTFGPWTYSKTNHAGVSEVKVYHWSAKTRQVVPVTGDLPIPSK